jgi:hypothetical protein
MTTAETCTNTRGEKQLPGLKRVDSGIQGLTIVWGCGKCTA